MADPLEELKRKAALSMGKLLQKKKERPSDEALFTNKDINQETKKPKTQNAEIPQSDISNSNHTKITHPEANNTANKLNVDDFNSEIVNRDESIALNTSIIEEQTKIVNEEVKQLINNNSYENKQENPFLLRLQEIPKADDNIIK